MSPAVVVNERQFASVKEEILPLPERFDWRRAPQRGDVNVAMLIDPPEGDRRVAASAGPVSRHRLWLNADVIHNGLNPIHLTRNLLHTILGLWIRCHAGEIDSILNSLHVYLSYRLEWAVRCKMRLYCCRDGRVVDVVPRGLGSRFTANGEKNGDTQGHQNVWSPSHTIPSLLT